MLAISCMKECLIFIFLMRYDYIFLEFSLHLKMKNYVLQDEFRTVTVDQLFF